MIILATYAFTVNETLATDELPVLGTNVTRSLTLTLCLLFSCRFALALSDTRSVYVPALGTDLLPLLVKAPDVLITPAAGTLALIDNVEPLTDLCAIETFLAAGRDGAEDPSPGPTNVTLAAAGTTGPGLAGARQPSP
jgi:hypothetical protein